MKLDELINNFGTAKVTADALKKDMDKWGAEIKQIMRESGDSVDEATDMYCAKFVAYNRTSMNEDKVIDLLKDTQFNGSVIKTKLYVDTDALEDAIYKNLIGAELMEKLQKCIEEKRVESLKVSVKKGKK